MYLCSLHKAGLSSRSRALVSAARAFTKLAFWVALLASTTNLIPLQPINCSRESIVSLTNFHQSICGDSIFSSDTGFLFLISLALEPKMALHGGLRCWSRNLGQMIICKDSLLV